ncbi:HI1506-related protein [Roseibium porphyridii]|uniref:HI1506-related protein n=1 Tax=Roseibium porphyridii TaxID=2866279 RepID=A0ABY8FGC8_9HYPH|nr:HI1506-related protein [Roseibium sp. KMA01]WFE92300.1 HI1506-related protein [Roseibium sp. KMA01]
MANETNPATKTAETKDTKAKAAAKTQPAQAKTAAPANTAPKATEAKKGSEASKDRKVAFRISSKVKAGIRRCGVRHPAEATDYPADRYTSKELEILKSDPDLVVVDLR